MTLSNYLWWLRKDKFVDCGFADGKERDEAVMESEIYKVAWQGPYVGGFHRFRVYTSSGPVDVVARLRKGYQGLSRAASIAKDIERTGMMPLPAGARHAILALYMSEVVNWP